MGTRFASFASFELETGSSPRVWGQATNYSYAFGTGWIIPTRVGTSKIKFTIFFLNQDHPHACGDKIFLTLIFYRRIGIIPTRVGTRKTVSSCRNRKQDHPHACGDKEAIPPLPLPLLGSSPRVWGQAILKLELVLCARIIPTRVGTSSSIIGILSVE